MCGIVAVMRRPGAKIELEPLAEAMVNLQRHRGPDNHGVLTNDQSDFAFGHSRLAILDLSTEANQPLASKDGVFTIVFNGEIYNWKELREQLIREGYGPFRTNSDTEVLLEAYRHFGYALPQIFQCLLVRGLTGLVHQSRVGLQLSSSNILSGHETRLLQIRQQLQYLLPGL